MTPPTRAEVRDLLVGLADGTRAPADADGFARPWVVDGRGIDDKVVWDAVSKLFGTDLLVAPGELLHSRQDFEQWLSDFDAECAAH